MKIATTILTNVDLHAMPFMRPQAIHARVLMLLLTVFMLPLVVLTYLPLPLASQGALSVFLLLVMWVCLRIHAIEEEEAVYKGSIARVLFLLGGVFLSLRYFFWRIDETLGWHGPFDFIAAWTLFLAESYGILIYFLGGFISSQLRERRSPSPDPYPSVDVVIPTYDEDIELLETTLLAAIQIRYPKDRLNVYLLDDGGTLQKRTDPDPRKAEAASRRHASLKALCKRIGAHYLTRERNEHAKAGNINAALPHLHGELLLILDADHVPTTDILEDTVGFFNKDPDLFLVQTPHHFLNADAPARNLQLHGCMPGENEMFYGVIQRGLDSWNASFFCGSAALLRRRLLDEVGGIQGETITEDAETALELHARGYKSAYFGHPRISGLQPETFRSFILQRSRWAQGMIQIFLLKNPLFKKGLSLPQRLCYLSSASFWFFPFARSVFLLAPTCYLLFGLKIYDANLEQFAVYALPHVVGAMLVAQGLYGHVRWAFVSELYEGMQSILLIPALIRVLRHPRSPSFKVTPKLETLDQEFVSSLAYPFFVLAAICITAMLMASWRWLAFPNEHDAVVITFLWNTFNLFLVVSALGGMFERCQRRSNPRLPVTSPWEGYVVWRGGRTRVKVEDISLGGAKLSPMGASPPRGMQGFLVLREFGEKRVVRLPMRVIFSSKGIQIRFVPQSLEDKRRLVRIAYGSSRLLEEGLRRSSSPPSFFRAGAFLFCVGLGACLELIDKVLRSGLRRLGFPVKEIQCRYTNVARWCRHFYPC